MDSAFSNLFLSCRREHLLRGAEWDGQYPAPRHQTLPRAPGWIRWVFAVSVVDSVGLHLRGRVFSPSLLLRCVISLQEGARPHMTAQPSPAPWWRSWLRKSAAARSSPHITTPWWRTTPTTLLCGWATWWVRQHRNSLFKQKADEWKVWEFTSSGDAQFSCWHIGYSSRTPHSPAAVSPAQFVSLAVEDQWHLWVFTTSELP